MAHSIAGGIRNKLPLHTIVTKDDLEYASKLGLLDAAIKYDPNKGVPFPSYATLRINGAILDAVRKLDWASRDFRRWSNRIKQVTKKLQAETEVVPQEEEIARELGISVDNLREKIGTLKDMRNIKEPLSLSRKQTTEDLPDIDIPESYEKRPDNMFVSQELRFALNEVIATLPERYQQAVSMYYTEGMTMKDVARVLGINESRVSQIIKSSLEKLNIALKERNIYSAKDFGLDVSKKSNKPFRNIQNRRSKI